jgi:hypothetical protein
MRTAAPSIQMPFTLNFYVQDNELIKLLLDKYTKIRKLPLLQEKRFAK